MIRNIFARTLAAVLAAVTVAVPALAAVSQDYVAVTAYAATTGTGSSSDTDWPVAPDITSASAILIDADTGAILYEKNSHEVSYPASTTKILTGLLTIENCSMDEIVTFSKEAANSVTWEDAQLGTKAGEQYTVEQALYGLLLHSANEIAYGLAEHVAGSLSAFTDMMNERAAECGALNTHFANASGLHDLNHYTTAYDMAMIARDCYNNTTFINIDSTSTTYTIPATNKTSTARSVSPRHQMLKGRTYEYEYCKGGKTGFTDEAGFTLVTFAEKDDMRLICVCFKSESETRYVDTRALFEWGFTNFKKITTSVSSISSMLTSDSFYDSAVFNQYKLNLNLNASTITLPRNLSVGDVTVDIDKNSTSTSSDGVYSAKLNFVAKGNVVGNATLTISTPTDLAAMSNLPYLTDDSGSSLHAKRCLVINLWAAIGTVLLVLVAIYAVNVIKVRRRRRRRRGRRRRLR